MASALRSAAQRSAFITRPEPEASQWVAALQAQGLPALAFPLIAIGAAPDTAHLQAARKNLSRYHAVMFVSGNAARRFFESNVPLALMLKAQQAIDLGASTRFWSPGPGTARTLQSLGVPAKCIDQPAADAGQFDSESLWQQVAPHLCPGHRVLIVRGSEANADIAQPRGSSGSGSGNGHSSGAGREWLSEQIRQAGGLVDYVAAYTRAAPTFTPGALAQARAAAENGSPWVLSSAQALGHLVAALPDQTWGQARAVSTHPRIAEAARRVGFGSITECRPALSDVAEALRALF